MNVKKLALASVLIPLFSLSLVACGGEDDPTAKDPAATSSSATPAPLTEDEQAIYVQVFVKKDAKEIEEAGVPEATQQAVARAVARWTEGDKQKFASLDKAAPQWEEALGSITSYDPKDWDQAEIDSLSKALEADFPGINERFAEENITVRDYSAFLIASVLNKGADAGECIEGSNTYGGNDSEESPCETAEGEGSFEKDDGYESRY